MLEVIRMQHGDAIEILQRRDRAVERKREILVANFELHQRKAVAHDCHHALLKFLSRQ
jgi:hypothetical protein